MRSKSQNQTHLRRQGQKQNLAEDGDSNDLGVVAVAAEQRRCSCTVFLVPGPLQSEHSSSHESAQRAKHDEVNHTAVSNHTLK